MPRENIIYSCTCNYFAMIIGAIDMLLSVVVFPRLMMEFSGQIDTQGKYVLWLGIDVDEFDVQVQNDSCVTKDSNITSTAERKGTSSHFIYFVCVFALAVFFTSMSLIWANIVMKKRYLVPWFIWKAICLLAQLIGYTRYNLVAEKPDTVVMLTGIIITVLTILAIYMVYQAMVRWPQIRRRPRSGLRSVQNGGSSSTQQTGEGLDSHEESTEESTEESNSHQQMAADVSNTPEGAVSNSDPLKNGNEASTSHQMDQGPNSPQDTVE